MNLKEVLDKTSNFFKEKGFASARLDAELLLGSALGMKRVELYVNFDKPLSEVELEKCRALIRRRSSGEPTAYILGYKDFYKSRFNVGPGVLIPRPETELMVEMAVDWLEKRGVESARAIDLGAGSGCIALSLALEKPTLEVVAVEKSEEAARYIEKNLDQLQVKNVSLLQSDVNEVLDNPAFIRTFDLVLANPPYIAESDQDVEDSVRKFEPSEALFSAEEGLAHISRWLKVASKLLKPNGHIIFEIGAKQGELVKSLFESQNDFTKVELVKDYSGLNRFVRASRL